MGRNVVSLAAWVVTALALALVTGCETVTSQAEIEALRTGMWVEAKGPMANAGDVVIVEEVEEVESDPGFSPDKMEITAVATVELVPDSNHLEIAGYELAVTPETRFETVAREDVARFPIRAGDWLKVKVRVKEGGALFARMIRRIEPRERFKILGRLGELNPEADSLHVGSLHLDRYDDMRTNVLNSDGDQKSDGTALGQFLQDEQKAVVFSIRPTESLLLGGQYSFVGRAEDERDLRKERKRDRQLLANELKLDLLWLLDDAGSFAFAEGTFGIRENLRRESHEETTYNHRLSLGYLHYVFSETVSVQVGRQDFDEEREWLYDEALDAVRLRVSEGPIDVELSGALGRDRDLLDQSNDTEDSLNLIGLLRYHVTSSWFLTAYFVNRTDLTRDDFSPTVVGVRSFDRPTYGLRHWIELATARGSDDEEKINGYAFDVGGSYVFQVPLRPTLTAGVAYASGDKNREGELEAFRQTGLQDNNAKFGGVTSFRYYGEVFDPELSNLFVTTLGVGARPFRNFATDVVVHTYHQAQAVDELVESDIREDPEGVTRYLGWEVDLIFGYRFRKSFNAELVLGRFEPGDAFDRDHQDVAHKAQIQLRVKF